MIGGGNTPHDDAPPSKRLGAEDVTIVYRRGPESMSATGAEQEWAQTNGVRIKYWAQPRTLVGSGGGNLVAVAADAPIDLTGFVEAMSAAELDWSAIDGAELDRWIGAAEVLVDDHAPVDQLLTPYG